MRVAERAERRDRGDDDRGDYLPDVGLAALAPIDVAVRFRRVGPVGRESVRVAVNARPVLLVHFVVVVEGDRGREAEVRGPDQASRLHRGVWEQGLPGGALEDCHRLPHAQAESCHRHLYE